MVDTAVAAIIGYAIGTAQILALDWRRTRVAHQRELRYLRSELLRVLSFDQKHGWGKGYPNSDYLPRPPVPTPGLLEAIASTDFLLTDQHADDNSQQAFLELLDGCALLQHYHQELRKLTDTIAEANDSALRQRMKEQAIEYAHEYDEELDRVQYIIRDALREINRRMAEAKLWRQAGRLFRRLKPGMNPPPLTKGDPRLRSATGMDNGTSRGRPTAQ